MSEWEGIDCCPRLTDQLTVEAWITCTQERREGLEALVSKWTPLAELGPESFAAYDAGRTDGLDATGYFGAVFDGRYVYFSPEKHSDMRTHGIVLRYDTHGDFKSPSSYEAYDAGATAGLKTQGYYGGACDGRYVYFIPRQNNRDVYHSRLLRFDMRGGFKDPASWDAHDLGFAQSGQSAAFNGRHLYLAPGYEAAPDEQTLCSRVIRYDTRGGFHHPGSYALSDIRAMLGAKANHRPGDPACFDGAVFDGRYVYFVPLQTQQAVRYDTRGGFGDPSAWQRFDGRAIGMGMNVGAVFDGRFVYYCAYNNPVVCRYDTHGDFPDRAAWTSYDGDHTDGLRTNGFDGGFFDGRYVWFVPFIYTQDKHVFHANFLRYDTRGEFATASSWSSFDASRTDGLATFGYNAGAYDGRYFYLAPWQQGPSGTPGVNVVHGTVLRVDTVGTRGSFSLRFSDLGHNGGLCAAAPGPTLLVNTERGVYGAWSHRAVEPGPHHVAGVYDGGAVRLYVDGELWAQQRCAGGRVVANDEPVAVGRIHGGGGEFHGQITRAAVRAEANPPRPKTGGGPGLGQR